MSFFARESLISLTSKSSLNESGASRLSVDIAELEGYIETLPVSKLEKLPGMGFQYSISFQLDNLNSKIADEIKNKCRSFGDFDVHVGWLSGTSTSAKFTVQLKR